MIYATGFAIFVTCLLWLLNLTNMKWLKHGTFSRRSNFVIDQHGYYMEEIKCKGYRSAFAAYQKNIEGLYLYGKVTDIKYDLYDWTVTYIQFKDKTIGIKLCRPMCIIQLVLSKEYMPIQIMEADNPFLEVKK